MGELPLWVGGVYPCGFGNLGSRAGKDGAWISKDMAAHGFTGFIGRRRVEGAERGKLREADVNTDFLCDLASCGLCRGFASFNLAAGQLELGGRIFAHGEDMAKGITENYGGNFNHGPDYNSLQRINSESLVPTRAHTQTVGLITTRMANEYKVVPMSDSRFPRSVFAVGTDPDPRFTLANERTFLAWIRTSLALIAGGVALEAFDGPLPAELRSAVSVFMLVVAIILPLVAWVHWKQSERAMREERPLPFSFAIPVLAVAIVVVAGALVVGEFLG